MLKTVPRGVQVGWGKPTKRSGKPMEFPMKSTNSLPTQLRYVKIYFFCGDPFSGQTPPKIHVEAQKCTLEDDFPPDHWCFEVPFYIRCKQTIRCGKYPWGNLFGKLAMI
jgi:hypothetical protein